MKANQIILTTAAFALGAASAGILWLVDDAGACSQKGGQGHSCSLDPAARADALDGLSAFSHKHLHSVTAAATAHFVGDKAIIGPALNAVIEREASCCSFLDIKLEETEDGYRVVIETDSRGVGELGAALTALRVSR